MKNCYPVALANDWSWDHPELPKGEKGKKKAELVREQIAESYPSINILGMTAIK